MPIGKRAEPATPAEDSKSSQAGQGQGQAQAQGPIRNLKSQTVEHYEKLVRDGMDGAGSGNGHGGGGRNAIVHRQYDPANFIVPGSDAQGHSERIQCRVPPGMLRQISAIVASKVFPFRTEGDVYRWAVWVGIQLLDRLEPSPNTFICRVDAANAIIREQIYLQEYQATLSELERMVQQYIGNGGTGGRGQAIRAIERVLEQYGKIEEDYWRERLCREVKERFGHIVGGGADEKV